MATVTVTADTYLDQVTYAAGDDIVVGNTFNQGVTLTIRQSNTVYPNRIMTTNSNIIVDSTINGNPIVVKNNANSQNMFDIQNSGKLTITGAWSYLGTGNGNANQSFNLPTGFTEMIPCCQVETGSNTDVWIDCISITSSLFLTYAGTGTDFGNYFNCTSTTITFGDGTNGMVVPNGARVRIPNVYITGNGIFTTSVGSRAITSVTNSGSIVLNKVLFSDRCRLTLADCKQSSITDVGVYAPLSMTFLNNLSISGLTNARDRETSQGLAATDINNSSITRYNSNCGATFSFANMSNVEFHYCRFQFLKNLNTSTTAKVGFSQTANIKLNDCFVTSSLYFLNSSNISIQNLKYSQNTAGASNTTALYAIGLETVSNFSVDNMYLASGGNNAYSGLLQINARADNITIKNSTIDCTNCAYVVYTTTSSTSYSHDLYIYRCNFTTQRTGFISLQTGFTKVLLKNVKGRLAPPTTKYSNYQTYGVYLTGGVPTSWNNYPDNYSHIYYTSDTAATIYFSPSPQVARTDMTITGNVAYDAVGGVWIKSGGEVQLTYPTEIVGISSINSYSIIAGGYTDAIVQYQIKRPGGNWSNWTNLSSITSETNLSSGFYLKLKLSYPGSICKFAGLTISCTGNIDTNYPLALVDLTLSNVVTGSTYAIYYNGAEVASGIASSSTVTVSGVNYDGDKNVTIRVRKAGYIPFETGGTITANGMNTWVSQVVDNIYQ